MARLLAQYDIDHELPFDVFVPATRWPDLAVAAVGAARNQRGAKVMRLARAELRLAAAPARSPRATALADTSDLRG